MRRVTCAACGAPTVLGASRCPKCLAPFGGESPTSGVVLVESPPRADGASEARRWRSVALAALGVLGIGGVLWWSRDRNRADAVAPSAPTEPVVADPVPSDTVPTAPDTFVAGAPAPEVATSGAVTSGAVTSDAALDSTQTFTYETLTWVRVRSAPSVDAEVLATLGPGTRVEVASIGRGWLALRWEGRTGWVGASLLTRVR
jgi:hypothetical protein